MNISKIVPSADRVRHYLPLALLAAISLAVFWPALGHDFLINWDDRQYILDNEIIRGLKTEHLNSAFTTFLLGNYAPLHLVSYMIDYEIWGMQPSGFIFTNVVLHTLNGLLFFTFLRRLSGNKIWIFFAALLFLLHPAQVESVAWIAERKTVLAMFFFLAGLIFYHEYGKCVGGGSRGWYFLSLFSILAALLTKSVVVIIPLVLVLFELSYCSERQLRRIAVNVLPFAALAVLTVIVALISHSDPQGGITAYHGGGPAATFLTMTTVLLRYLGILFWPANLSAFYDVPVKTSPDAEVAWAAAVCMFLLYLGWRLYRNDRKRFFWYALFFAGLLPVSQIVPIVTLMNDRYLYFPMMGAAAFLSTAALPDITWRQWADMGKPWLRLLVVTGLMAACAAASSLRIDVWQNSYTLWGDAAKKAPGIALTHECFGEGLLQKGLVDDAISEFTIALKLYASPSQHLTGSELRNDVASAHNNLGVAYGTKGLTDLAIEQFSIAIRLNPQLANAHFNLGNALIKKSRLHEALRSFETAVNLAPQVQAYQANLRLTRELILSSDGGKISTGQGGR